MNSVDDIVRLHYTPDLTEGGIVDACRGLSRLYVASGNSPYDTVRRAIAATAADLAFRRHLAAKSVDYVVERPVPFSGTDLSAIRIGQHACLLQTYFISRPEQIAALEAEPELALKMKAMVPLDRFVSDGLGEQDIYVFALVLGTDAKGSRAKSRSGEYWLHIMPLQFRRPLIWVPMGPVMIGSDVAGPIELELGGGDGFGSFIDRRVSLGAEGLCEVLTPFHSITYVHTHTRPAGKLTLKCSARQLTHAINTGDWEDVWIDGREILLMGWLPRYVFQGRARLMPSGSRVFQFHRTRTKNLAVDTADLRPMSRLLEVPERRPSSRGEES